MTLAPSREEPEMWRVAARSGAGYVVVHMQGTPRTMQVAPRYDDDVTVSVQKFFADRLSKLLENGVASEQVMLDVGIGFGKTADHNLRLLHGAAEFYQNGIGRCCWGCRANPSSANHGCQRCGLASAGLIGLCLLGDRGWRPDYSHP